MHKIDSIQQQHHEAIDELDNITSTLPLVLLLANQEPSTVNCLTEFNEARKRAEPVPFVISMDLEAEEPKAYLFNKHHGP